MNLPVTYKLVNRNPNPRPAFRNSWGAKTEGIKEGDYVEGVILGFEDNDFNAKNIVLKNLATGGHLIVWSCSSLMRELFVDDKNTHCLYEPGDVIRVTYQGGYIGKKGMSKGKFVAIFQILGIEGYALTEIDIQEISDYQKAQIQTKPLNAYRQATTPAQKHVGKTQFQRTKIEDDSFDV